MCGAATGFDSGDPRCLRKTESTASTPTARNSLCQFWKLSYQPPAVADEEGVCPLNGEVVHPLLALHRAYATYLAVPTVEPPDLLAQAQLPGLHPPSFPCVERVLGGRGDLLAIELQIHQDRVVVHHRVRDPIEETVLAHVPLRSAQVVRAVGRVAVGS